MITLPTSQDWLFWGIAIMVGLPILIVLLGELVAALERRGLTHYRKPLDLLRNSSLILLFVVILLRYVVGLAGDHIAVRVVDTAFWITVINAALALFNSVVFRPGTTDWRARAPKLLVDIGRLLLVALCAALVVSHVWGVDLRGLLAAFGVGSLVIGLALQDTLGNVFSGIAMISARQFKVGDWIRVGDVEGQVRAINWRTVAVGTLTGDLVIIPNSQIARDRLRVLGADEGWLRIITDLKVSYEHTPELVLKVLQEAVAATKDLLAEPKATVRIASYEDYAILYRVSYCIREYRAINPSRGEFLTNLWYIAERHGIVFPARYNHRFDLPAESIRPRTAAPEVIAERLHGLQTFQQPVEALRPLLDHARIQTYRAGETLLRFGQRASHVWVITQGIARALDTHDGKETAVETFEKADLILFKSAFRSAGAPLTVRAATDLEVIAIPLADLEAELACSHTLAVEVDRQLALREQVSERTLAKTHGGKANGNAEEADRVAILKGLFRG